MVVNEPAPKPEPIKPETYKAPKTPQPPPPSTLSLTLLNDLNTLRRRLEVSETSLTYHLHMPLGENSVHECTQHLQNLQVSNSTHLSVPYEQMRV